MQRAVRKAVQRVGQGAPARLLALQQPQVRALAAAGVEDVPLAAGVGAVCQRARYLRCDAGELRSEAARFEEGAARASHLGCRTPQEARDVGQAPQAAPQVPMKAPVQLGCSF